MNIWYIPNSEKNSGKVNTVNNNNILSYTTSPGKINHSYVIHLPKSFTRAIYLFFDLTNHYDQMKT